MKIAKLATVALALLPAIAVGSTYSEDAAACGMSVRLEPIQKPTPVQEIARAEKALEGGQSGAAARTVLATVPKVRSVVAGQNPLDTRALRVFALAVVRSNGALSEKSMGFPTGDEWTASSNLEWAVQALREIDEKRPNDPTVQADLGEALAKIPRTEGEAYGILQKLADKDLMGSPYAYAALAKLRTDKGDSAGAEAAIKRCTEMSKMPGICKPVTPPAGPSRPSAPSANARA
jgi:Flp pilus assembly protein TadD